VSAIAPKRNAGSGRSGRVPRRGRLLRHADFERVYRRGNRHFAPHMTVFYLEREPAESEQSWRVGFTVSRALGGAVVRNRMRRRLREAVRLQWPRHPVAADVVINPKKSLLMAKFSDLLQEVGRAFKVVEQKLANDRR
jgi:ribonuclease P protein component